MSEERLTELVAQLRDVFPFPEEKDWDNGYKNISDGWNLASIVSSPEHCLEIMIGVLGGEVDKVKNSNSIEIG